MVTPVHKNTIALLILIVCNVTFGMLAKYIIGNFSRIFDLFDPPKIALCCAQDNLGGQKKSWPHRKTPRNRRFVFYHKKMTSRTIRNNGA